MMSTRIVEKIRTRGIKDDLDALYYSKSFNTSLKNSYFFQFIPTEVTKVDNGFYITPNLQIAIATLKKVLENGPIDKDELLKVYEGAIIHENMHVLGFPMMARIKEIMSPFVDYLSSRGIEV
jgi:hypothetical protein